MKHITKSEKQTFNLGKKIAKTLKGGEILALIGELGAGKTVFVKGVAAGLGVKQIVTSPTFVLMKVYPIKDKIKQLVHIDCYRIINPKEIFDIGATEYFDRKDTVTMIEWADKIKNILPKRRISINIKLLKDNLREITIKI